MQCTNNLKQIGLALHTYHDATKSLPYAATWQGASRSWSVALFPYIEQQAVYSNLEFTLFAGGFDTRWTSGDSALVSAKNWAALNNLVVSGLYCPSSELTKMTSTSVSAAVKAALPGNPGSVNAQKVNYVGISGTYLNPRGNLTTDLSPDGYEYDSGYGFLGLNGVIIPENGQSASKTKYVDIAAIKDGTSNTVCIAEQSEAVWNSTKTSQNEWMASGHNNGGWCGQASEKTQSYTLNITTIRYTINSVCSGAGCGAAYLANTIITSPHTGGANFAVCDGSVRYISDSVDFNNVLLRLASRNDKLAVTLP